MSNSFRIDETELRTWHAALAPRTELRGVPAIAKEIEAHLGRKEADGSVVVSRHQLFTWSEALQGATVRAGGAALAPVVADMRAILTGKPAGGAGKPAGSAGAYAPAPQAPVLSGPAPAPVSPYASRAPPPPVVYASAASAASTATSRVLTGQPLADAVRDLVRSATRELYVSSPWETGVETLVADIAALPPGVRVLVLSRRPQRDDGPFHQAMDSLGRRRAITAWSPYIQTRLVIADDARAIVGAASVPGINSREIGILVTDAATVAALRGHFERAHSEAAGPTR